jgi:hypothetical protein
MSEKVNLSLSSSLGISPIEKQEVLPPAIISDEDNNLPDQSEDYKLARKTFRSLIDKGNNAIEDLTDLARQSESPRAYEVLATLMKTVGETTKDLYDLQKKTKDLLSKSNEKKLDETTITVDRAVFVGTTAELLKQIRSKEDNA